MKKISWILLLATLAVLLVIPTFADQTATVNINPSKDVVYEGDSVTFTVRVSGVTAAKSIGIIPMYDVGTFKLVSGSWIVTGSAISDFSGGTASIAYASERAFNENVFRFTLEVKDGAELDTYEVDANVSIKNGNETVTCNVNAGEVEVACKHSYSEYTSLGAAQHSRTCSKCKAVEKTDHTYTNTCDTKCNDCNYTRTTTHRYKTTWSSNGTQHWHECSVCKDKKDIAAHIPGEAATELTAQKCTVCERVLVGVLDHVHSFGDEWKSDENGHYHECLSCGSSSELQDHVFDNACDTECNICSYKRSIEHTYEKAFKFDADGHYRECSVCQSPSKSEKHKFDSSCDEKCDECGYIREVEHTWDSGTVVKEPQGSSLGEREYKCTKCGGTKSVEIEYIRGSASSTTQPSKSTVNPIAITIAGFLAGLAIGAGAVLIIKREF